MSRIKTVTVAVLLASFVGMSPVSALADQGRGRRDRYEDQRERREERREAQRERREDRRDDRRDWREDRRDDWDASRYYRQNDRSSRARRMNRNDRIYRGSDNRYYCRRDDGTTGLIVGGVSGAVLGTIIGAGAGALIGRAIDDGDMVCR